MQKPGTRLERRSELIDWAQRPDRTGATAGGASVRDVEALLRLPAGALPRPSPPYHRDVFKLLAYNLRRAVRVLTGAPASP